MNNRHMLVKAIPKPNTGITPDTWRVLVILLRVEKKSARIRLGGFVGGAATKQQDERWFSLAGAAYDRLIAGKGDIVTEVYNYINGQAKDDTGALLYLDANSKLTTIDTGTPAGNVDEVEVRGEFYGLPIS